MLDRLSPAQTGSAPTSVAIIVPARDEEHNISACLETLRTQSARPEVIVTVDDHSSDATASIVADLSARDSTIVLRRAPALPPGWLGKSHACWIGEAGVTAEIEWLCFVDADIRAEPQLIATALAEVERRRLDFLSLTPRQVLVSFAERLVMPCGLYLLAFCQDLARMQAPTGDSATATGQFILVRRSAYRAVGGHQAVRGDVSEDTALARVMKRAGYRVTLAGGDLLLRTRMYTGWRSLWIGVSKNLVDMIGGPTATMATAVAGVVLAWAAVALPLADALACSGSRPSACWALGFAGTGAAAALALHVFGSLFFRIPAWYGLLFPLGYTAGAMMAVDSVRRRATGRVSWKGRTYP